MKTLSDFSKGEQSSIRRVARELSKELAKSKLTQAEFAKKLGETRTTVSHIINSVRPSTMNPVFKSMKIINRIASTLKLTVKVPVAGEPMEDKQEKNKAFNSILGGLRRYIRIEVKEAVREEIAAAKAAKVRAVRAMGEHRQLGLPNVSPPATPKPAAKTVKTVKKNQVWKPRDKRRIGLVEVVAVHTSASSSLGCHVTTRSQGGMQSRSTLEGFLKRYEYVAASKGRVKKGA